MRRFFVASLSGALLAVLSTQAVAGTRAVGFRIVETPTVEGPGLLAAVAALSSSDVWAVGEAGGEALVEHWDGSGWAILPAPSPGDSASLLGISALGPDDVWAAGVAHRGTRSSGLLEHWDGSRWSVTLTRAPVDLNDVDARTADDAWAVGAGPYLTHWDGHTWQVALHAPIEEGELHGVTTLAADDAWAVGEMETESNPPHPVALLYHWQGSVWELVRDPARSMAQELWAVDGTSSSDVWAVGSQETARGQKTFTLHYDGTSWFEQRARNPGSAGNELVGVVTISPTNVWAVGTYDDGVAEHPMAQHWDGARWQLVPVENAPGAPPIDSLLAVDGSPRANVWTVGLAGPDDSGVRPLVERLARS